MPKYANHREEQKLSQRSQATLPLITGIGVALYVALVLQPVGGRWGLASLAQSGTTDLDLSMEWISISACRADSHEAASLTLHLQSYLLRRYLDPPNPPQSHLLRRCLETDRDPT